MFSKLTHIHLTAIIVAAMMLYSLSVVAQVTIGSGLNPKSGSLLDLKEYDISPNGDMTTAKRGLGLPRVKLVQNSLLDPLFSTSDPIEKQQYAGMLLYNVGDEITESLATQLCKGIHVWSGTKWVPLLSYPKTILGESVVRCKEGPSYTIDPNSILVYGSYTKNTVLNNTHYIELTINSPADIIGGEYIIQTYSATTNEFKFEARGTITSTQQVIRLQGVGTVETAGDKKFVLITNSPSERNKYPVTVQVAIPVMRIVGVGTADYQPASMTVGSKSYMLMNNPKAFGMGADAKIKVEGFQFENYVSRSDAQWISLFTSNPDIIIRSYVASISNNAAVLTALKNYLDAGGVFLDFNDNNLTSSAGVKALYGTGANSQNVTGSTVTGQIHPFTDVDDEILNGPWLDLRNKSWSEDASITQGISGVPEDRIIIYSRSNTNDQPVVVFRDKAVKYVYVGDGGFLSGAAATSTCCYPYQLDANNLPRMSTNDKGVMYNSHFFANLITWALKEAATNGINEW